MAILKILKSIKGVIGLKKDDTDALRIKINEIIDTINDYSDGSQEFAEHITDTTQSSSVSTGALIVDGGAGIAKAIYIGGLASIAGAIIGTATTDSTSSTTGAVKTAGGLGVAKALYVGTNLVVVGATDSTTTTSGSLITAGGLGVAKAVFIGTTLNVAGVSTLTGGVVTGVISEAVANAGVAIDGLLALNGVTILKPTAAAINSTGAATAAQIAGGLITSTSAAATAITTPTATAIAAVIGAARGTSFELVIDNSVGADTVTLTLDGSIVVETAVITGGDTLTIASGKVGIFKIYFISGVAAIISRIV